MILEELYLQNFCLYKGLHRFDLAPDQGLGRLRPIILFGGMNGAGKTTILDAVQLALYGSRARSANRVGKPYEEYLRECVHRGSATMDGTSVSIKFKYHAEGQLHTYEVSRGWSLRDKVLKERVRVTKDDTIDAFLSENWSDVVEELIPIGISQLFFFDAEKVRFLADDDTDSVALGTAIKSLLGLDLAERLISDAAILKRRLSEAILSHSTDEHVVAIQPTNDHMCVIQQKMDSVLSELGSVKSERASLENSLLRSRRAVDKANAEFRAAGGEHWRIRSELHADLTVAESSINAVEGELRDLCSSELPLLLVPGLISAVQARDRQEQENENAIAFQKMMKERDKKIVRHAKEAKMSASAIDILERLFEADRKRVASPKSDESVLNLSGQAKATLSRLVSGGIDDLQRTVKKMLDRLNGLRTKREKYLRSVNATPAEESIVGFVERLRVCAEERGILDGNAKRLDDRIDVLRRERDELEGKLVNLRQSVVKQSIEEGESLRMARLAERTQATMKEFLKRATAQKIEKLSELVTTSFQYLLKKQSLVARVEIHPDTFRIELFDDTGKSIPKGRLSEGEKQLFAIALLWGLAQASPRQLPSIIDTPMARLDSEHREHLVERYFPNASHQVIILSTDTEVELGYFEMLKPRIARSYHLRYDEGQRATQVTDGYFWPNAAESSS